MLVDNSKGLIDGAPRGTLGDGDGKEALVARFIRRKESDTTERD